MGRRSFISRDSISEKPTRDGLSKSFSSRWSEKRYQGDSGTLGSTCNGRTTDRGSSEKKSLYDSKASKWSTDLQTLASFCFAPFSPFPTRPLLQQSEILPPDFRAVSRRVKLKLNLGPKASSDDSGLKIWDELVRRNGSRISMYLKAGHVEILSFSGVSRRPSSNTLALQERTIHWFHIPNTNIVRIIFHPLSTPLLFNKWTNSTWARANEWDLIVGYFKERQLAGDKVLATRPDGAAYGLWITGMGGEISSNDCRRADGVVVHSICYRIV